MTHRFAPHLMLLVAMALAVLLLSARSLKPQVSQAFQHARPAPSQPATPPRVPPEAITKYDFLACRRMSDALMADSRQLQEQSSRLAYDCDQLWRIWKNQFGIRGGWLDWGRTTAPPQAPADEFKADKLQTRLFRLAGRASELSAAADDLAAQASAVDADLRAAGFRSSQTQRRSQEGGLSREEAVSMVLDALSRLTLKTRSLDSDIRDLQEEFDRSYLLLKRYMQERVGQAPVLARPWHWAYMLGDRPRPSLRGDFESRYAAALARAHKELEGAAPASP